MDTEKQFWHGNGFWGRHFGRMSVKGKLWFWLTLAAMVFCGFYIGFWISCQRDNPIDVPYVTSTSFIENKEQALAAAKDYLGEDGKMTILLLGCDIRANDVGRSDTIMVAFVDLETPAVDLLSIPRDTYVDLADGKGKTKINHAFAYGGVPLTRKTVENFLGVEIDRYVQVDFQGFAALIDALGGIDYDVEMRMYRPSDNIDLQPGLQTLNGTDALGYVRFRGTPTADIGRVERQQKFLNAVADKVLSAGTVFKLPKLVGVVEDNVKTDLSSKELLSLIEVFKGATGNEMKTAMVPGDGQMIGGVSYWVPNQAELKTTVEELLKDGNDHAAEAAEQTPDPNATGSNPTE